MGLLELFILAVGLSMDAFAVSVCKGLSVKKMEPKHALICGAYFGGFQALMPFIGYLLGAGFEKYINAVASWIAFVLLALIGGNMIREALSKDEENASAALDVKTMFLMAVATSIDALAVGITFACVPVEIMAASLGVRDFHVYVLTNGIFASAHLPGRDAVSLVRHVPTVSVHLGRVEAVNELSRELAAGRLGVVEAEARLNTARTLPRSTPQLEILACVVGSAGFAYLFGGTLADMPVAAVAGLLEALVCQQFARHGINRIFTDIVAAFCGTIWAIAVQTVVPAVNANAAIIGALMVLTPGVALTMGVRDILNGDYLSGSIRLLDALLIAGSIAGGVVLGWIMARGLGVA